MDLPKYFKKSELTPVVDQDVHTKEVLMLGYTDEVPLSQTLATKSV